MSPIAIYTSLQTKRLILILNRKNLKSTNKTNVQKITNLTTALVV